MNAFDLITGYRADDSCSDYAESFFEQCHLFFEKSAAIPDSFLDTILSANKKLLEHGK